MVADELPFVSITVPCRNEARFIRACLDSILASDYPLGRLEVLVSDGMSEDGTRDIVAEYATRHPVIRLIDNPKRIVPAALNAAIGIAKGEIIVRMDAHEIYPPEYLPRLVAELEQTGADNVGGVIVTLAADGTPTARAIAVALSQPFGVGNAYFRIGADARRWADTVPFGCFRREVFDRIGGFDEDMVRNEDDEFNLRLIKHGGRVLLLPEVVSYYRARKSLVEVADMYYQYGRYKPLVARKLGGVMTGRQIVPALFLSSLLALGLVSIWVPVARAAAVAIAGCYAALVIAFSARAVRKHGLRCAVALTTVFPTIHVCYGIGFLYGVLRYWTPFTKSTRTMPVLPVPR